MFGFVAVFGLALGVACVSSGLAMLSLLRN